MSTVSTIAPSAHTPTRRDLLRTTPAAAAALAMPAAALAASNGDAKIIAAWERRLASYNKINSPTFLEDSPEDKACWAEVDAAERLIRESVATTPRGVEVQLWTALYHSADFGRPFDDLAAIRGDLAHFDGHEPSLDWNTRLTLAAIRSLRAMGSR